MNPVDDKMKLFSDLAAWLVMKRMAMNHVLKQRPKENTDQEQTHRSQYRQLALPKLDIKRVSDRRSIDHQRFRRMHVRKKLHEIAFEHASAFVFFRNVELIHGESSN